MTRATLRNLLGFARRYRNFWEVWRNFRRGSPISRIVLWNSWEFTASDTTGALLLALYNEVWHQDCYRIASAGSPFRVGRTDVVVDIGANIGLFTMKAARLAREGMVLAVEPDRRNFDLLTSNLAAARLANVRPRNAAVGGVAGRASLHMDSFATHTLTAIREYPEIAHTVPSQVVDVVTLDALVGELGLARIDLLKIDAEGAEWDILAAASDDTWEIIRRIALEYHDVFRPGTSSYLTGELARRGFEVEKRPTTESVGLIFARR